MPERLEDCIRVVKSVITPEMNSDLVKQISNEEVEKAVFTMNGLGSLGPDGFPAIFYQKHWQTIGPSVCAAVREAFCSGSWPQDFNAIFIALIPKVKKPSKVSEFRPISLCNILYKILAKVLANRLQKILPQIISPSQSAFIPDRLITNNAIAAFEVMHTMNTSLKGKDGYMALKLDMSKAYDRLEWSFLQEVMLSYSVLINGIPQKPFKPSRGIRQGDPLSPYLFIIGAEALSRLIQDADDRGDIKGANQYEWNRLFKLLDTYEKSSGQRLNKEKNLIFFSKNTRDDVKQQIIQVAGVKSSHPYDRYLGLPTLIGRNRTRGFKHILERVRGKLSNWKMKYLSQAGKEALFKAVIQALPTYSMGVFKIPKTILQELNRLIKSYCWGQKNDEKRIHWCSWDKMKLSKNDGGLGFRDLELFNLAMLAKQGWRLLHYPNSLTVKVLFAKYYPDGNFLEAKVKRSSSFIWRSVMAARAILESGLMWCIGDGSKVRIWQDKWLPSASSFKIQSQCLEVNIICRIPISIFKRRDKIVWRYSQNGLFSVKSAYHLQVESQISSRGQSASAANDNKKWKKLWKLPITNAEKLFLWKACQDILPTKCNLVKKKLIEEPFCTFCCLEEEDVLHALWGCVAAKDIWSSCSLIFQKMNNNFTDFRELIMVLLSKLEEKYLAEFGVVTSPNAHPLNSDPSSPRWQPPPEGIYKVNWDAIVRKENGTIGVGIAIRDWQGRFLATMRMKKTMLPDALVAESFAALQAVILAAYIGINQIILEGDALQVVNNLLRDEENWGQTGLISMDTKVLSRNFLTFSVHHVKRASNVIAHTLAKNALTIDDVLVELEEVLNCIGSLVDPIE
ncbi:hypothetical protein Patl1_28743 [Pistacia atlantica]|uniref:Uncharacterized protein n=1 Tax=Pistacia atlantica TaxID=434234 RepID=A0ACC1BDT9_9ROSI|nr:hypothetical protein Patl1_28743 [Pistacia atlantica]